MLRARDILISECNKSTDRILLSKSDLAALQEHLFEMYKDIETICQRHNLSVTLAFGNVIGAIRHGGWIPWDDDLDIYMPRADYDRFVRDYVYELSDKYVVYSLESTNGPIVRFSKVIDTTTVFSNAVEVSPPHCEGIFIDIFPLDDVPSSRLLHKSKKSLAFGIIYIQNSIIQKKYSTDEYKNIMCSSPKGKYIYCIRLIIGTVFGIINLKTWFKWLDKLIMNDSGSSYIYCGISTKKGWIPMEKSVIFPPKKFMFSNGKEVYIPNQPERYLSSVYGNWQEIPDDKDKWHHYCKDFKLPGYNC